jgi:hypothetical protein
LKEKEVHNKQKSRVILPDAVDYAAVTMCDPMLVPLGFHLFHSLRSELPCRRPSDDKAAKYAHQECLPDADVSDEGGAANICLNYSSALKNKETRSSENSVYFQQTTLWYISEDRRTIRNQLRKLQVV